MNDVNNLLLKVRGLKKYFPIKRGIFRHTVGWLKAVDGLDLDVAQGESLGLAGESGCGKTTAIRTMIRAYEPTEGTVHFYDGEKSIDVMSLSHRQLRALWRNIQYVFQDPYASLDPRLTVRDIVAEPLIIHRIAKGRELSEKVASLLERVGLNSAHMNRYPHAFSGGQRQRIGIARSLALQPKLVLLDEPVSALDVSVRAQVLNLLMELQEEFKLTYIIVAHDLAVLERFCDRIAIMYLGQIMELAESREIFSSPQHPYTKALLSAVPIADPEVKMKREIIKGDTVDLMNLPKGCKFCNRCALAEQRCRDAEPEIKEIGKNHFVRCCLVNK